MNIGLSVLRKKNMNNSWRADAVCNTFKPHCLQVSLCRKHDIDKNPGKLTFLLFGKGGEKNPQLHIRKMFQVDQADTSGAKEKYI